RRSAIDRNKTHRPARARLVDRLCDQLLAGARLAPDENVGLGRRGLLNGLVALPHRRVVADHLAEAAVLAELLTQRLRLAQRVLALNNLVEKDFQSLGIDRLGEVVV